MADLIAKFNELFGADSEPFPAVDTKPNPPTGPSWAAQAASMAANIQRSAVMRAELNKAIRAGGDPWELLLQATEIIGLMTGDMMTHQIAKAAHPHIPQPLKEK